MTDDMTDDELEKTLREIAKENNLEIGIRRDGCTQVMLSQEHQEISAKAVYGFFHALDGFTQLEVAAILTGMLAQWAGTGFPNAEVALKILGGVFEGASTGLAHATEAGLTNWAKDKTQIN